jgi:hypothetical protein
MPKIIRKDFTVEDFNRIVEEFLYSDTRISLRIEQLNGLKDRLFKAGPSFQKTFHSYFEFEDNTRYDYLTRREEAFIEKLHKYNADMNEGEKQVFALFWKEVAEIIREDCAELEVQYLTNSCNYFIWEINKLT